MTCDLCRSEIPEGKEVRLTPDGRKRRKPICNDCYEKTIRDPGFNTGHYARRGRSGTTVGIKYNGPGEQT